MAVIKHGPSPEDHFSLISNSIARNPNITLKTKGVYIYLRSHREGWSMSTERIAEALNVSRATIGRAVNELIEHGYLVREQSRGEGGMFGSSDYIVMSEPLVKNDTTDDSPCVKTPHTVNADNGVLTQHKKTNSSKKTIEDKEDNPPLPPKGASDPFDEWWEHYPKKVGKGQARTAFKRALKKIDLDTLMDGTRQLAAHHQQAGTDKKFIPNPSTWLNGERWDDELIPVNGERTPSVDEVLSWNVTHNMNENREVPF